MMLFAAAMALSSCQKQEMDTPEMIKVEGLNFSAEKPEFDDASKTEWTGSTIQWSKGDVIRVAYICDGVWQNADGTATREEEDGKKTAKLYASSGLSEASASAKFSVPGNFKGEASGIYEFYAVYPSGSAVKDSDFPHAPSLTVDIPSKQTPLSGSFDSTADLMAAKSVETFEGLPKESISLLWTRVVAHGHLTLKNLQTEDGEKLQTIRLTADADADMVGHHNLYLDTYNVAKADGNNAANSLTVKANNLTIDEGGNVTFWTCFLPCTWKSLEVVVDTDRATYTRAIDLTGKEKTFVRNARNTLGINMASADKVRKGIPSLPFVKDFSGITGTLETVYKATGAIRLASGSANGLLSTVALNLSDKFHVIVTACGWDEGEVKMTVSAGDQTNDVDLTTYGAAQKPGAWVDYVMNFAPVDSIASVQFSAVKNARYFIQKIQILPGHADLPSVLLATAPSKMSQAGGKGEFSYTLKNPKDGFEVTATESVDWIDSLTVDQETKTVSYTVAENTSAEAREATITLSYEGESVEVIISQAGKPAPGEEIDVLTRDVTGVTGTTYASWSGKTSKSSAVYAGQSAGGNSSIQLRTTNSNSGVITTASGGKVKKVTVTWNSNTTSGRTLQVYGKSTAYGAPTDLYSSENRGTLLGTIVNGTSTELVISGDYAFIGLRSKEGAMYLTEIQITWDTSAGSGGGTVDPAPEPEPEPDPTPDPDPEEPSGTTFTKYTGELTEGDYLIVYDGGAMKAEVVSSRLKYGDVTVVNDSVTTSDATIVWHIAPGGEYWTIYNASAGKYAAGTGAQNKAQLLASGTDDRSLWTVTGDSTYEFVNKANEAAGVNKTLRRNGKYGFACYSTSTGGVLTLYKKM